MLVQKITISSWVRGTLPVTERCLESREPSLQCNAKYRLTGELIETVILSSELFNQLNPLPVVVHFPEMADKMRFGRLVLHMLRFHIHQQALKSATTAMHRHIVLCTQTTLLYCSTKQNAFYDPNILCPPNDPSKSKGWHLHLLVYIGWCYCELNDFD